jgi:replicative DNA helicase
MFKESKEAIAIEKIGLYNIQAEQIVLGVIILNNDYLGKVIEILKKEYFYEPAHQIVYEHIIGATQRANIIADSVTMKGFFDSDELLKTIGGSKYLSILLSMGAGIVDIVDYAKIIQDLALKRSLVFIGEEIVNDAYKKASKVAAAKQIEIAESKLFELSYQGEFSRGFTKIVNPMAETIHKAKLALERDDSISGIPTNYIDLDKILSGLQNSDLIIVAGRPSMGKSALAINIAYNVARFFDDQHKQNPNENKKAVGIFSLEMSADQVAARVLSIKTGINSNKFRTGEINREDFDGIVESADEISKLPLFIDDTPALSITSIRTRTRRLVRQQNLGLIVVDYLQLIRGTNNSSQQNRVQEISEITQGLKAIAKEFNIPVLALSQLSRAVEARDNKRPMLQDLRESGSIEQDADIVMFIYRQAYYEERKKPADGDPKMDAWINIMNALRNKSEVIIAKHRNGPIGDVALHWDGNTTKFSDYAGYYDKTADD